MAAWVKRGISPKKHHFRHAARTAPRKQALIISSRLITTHIRCLSASHVVQTITGRIISPEKLIPLIIKNILEGKKLPVYGDGSNVRDWLYVTDHCKAIDAVISLDRKSVV